MGQRIYPKIGEQLYLRQVRGGGCIEAVKRPYTVIDIRNNRVIIQKAKCIFDPKDNYFNSLPIAIKPSMDGEVLALSWSPKNNHWFCDPYSTGYRQVAFFGKYEYFPYLD